MLGAFEKAGYACLSIFLALFFVFVSFYACSRPVSAQESGLSYSEDRPANFVFLLDVSGSIVSPRTMVKAKDGSSITLFEALRQSLLQMVRDERLLSPNSKVGFVTFGTSVTEKKEWPSSLAAKENRDLLLAKIASATELSADKHGDTYMAGGLAQAFETAERFMKDSAPCTSTFVIMLTDGWDEPPAGARYNIKDEAARFRNKQDDLKRKLGTNTWQIRVIGLQRLPDKKAGTTTASEVAKLLGGEFLDVSKSESGTIAERIYAAMKKTIAELKGQIDLPVQGSPESVLNFGLLGTEPQLKSSCNLLNRSCYVEKITAASDCTKKIEAVNLTKARREIARLSQTGSWSGLPHKNQELVLSSQLPESAIRISLEKSEYLLAPQLNEDLSKNQQQENSKIGLIARIGSSCPPGSYLGFIQFESTARMNGQLPYVLSVPSRLAVAEDIVQVQVRKPGFIFNRDTSAKLSFKAQSKVASNYKSNLDVNVRFSDAKLISAKQTSDLCLIASNLINEGKTLELSINGIEEAGSPVLVNVRIPADTKPGRYEGKLNLECRDSNALVGNCSVPFFIEVLPSPWDEMSPLVIPTLSLLLVSFLVFAFMAFVGRRDRL